MCGNHPFLLRDVENEIRDCEAKSEVFALLNILCQSGKGHRVIIVSQSTKMPDIIEDYLEERGMESQRIDALTTGMK
jgi:SNF2 family DNA or RNA helicase